MEKQRKRVSLVVSLLHKYIHVQIFSLFSKKKMCVISCFIRAVNSKNSLVLVLARLLFFYSGKQFCSIHMKKILCERAT